MTDKVLDLRINEKRLERIVQRQQFRATVSAFLAGLSLPIGLREIAEGGDWSGDALTAVGLLLLGTFGWCFWQRQAADLEFGAIGDDLLRAERDEEQSAALVTPLAIPQLGVAPSSVPQLGAAAPGATSSLPAGDAAQSVSPQSDADEEEDVPRV